MGGNVEISVSNMQGKVPVTVIHVSGQVDASNAQDFESKATGAVKAGARDLLLDMSRLTFMSSAGFRVVHKLYTSLHPEIAGKSQSPSHLKIFSPPAEVRRVAKTMGFDRYVSIVDGDLRGAVDSF